MAADTRRVFAALLTAADLPPVAAFRVVDANAYGLDNRLIGATLDDDREVLLRQNSVLLPSPRLRADFLRSNGIPLPWLYASDDDGNSLWEFVPGRPVGDLVEQGEADDETWRRIGQALAAVHSVEFPAPLQGPIGVDSLELRPLDPVDELIADIDAARLWAAQQLPDATLALDRVAAFVADHTAQIRAARPTITHGDTNLLNIIASEQAVHPDRLGLPKGSIPARRSFRLWMSTPTCMDSTDYLPPSLQATGRCRLTCCSPIGSSGA